MNSTCTWLITFELGSQRARIVLFTCVVYTKCFYILNMMKEQLRDELQEQHWQQVHVHLSILFLGAGNQDGSGSPQTKTMKDYEYVSDY